MSSNHIIARCVWQTDFDQPDQYAQLQDFISEWSRFALPGEIFDVFSRVCPMAQTWRIDQLQLNLGEIRLETIDEELPRRLQSSLEAALSELLQDLARDPHQTAPRLTVLDAHHSLLDTLAYYLVHGHMPWWSESHQSAPEIYDILLSQYVLELSELLYQLGQEQAIRLRIVRQFGEARIRASVLILEPRHGHWIIEYADQMVKLQSQHSLVHARSADFRQLSWLFILEHLLVDRGSLFNTANFIHSHLYRLAQHFQINFSVLLETVFNALDAMEQRTELGSEHRIFSALRLLQTRHEQRSATLVEAAPVDYFETLRCMLKRGETSIQIDTEFIALEDVFSYAAERAAVRLARLLRQDACTEAVCRLLSEHFSEHGLRCAVVVLEPVEYPFIIEHVQHAQNMPLLPPGGQKSIWKLVLVYLLLERGSYFQRKQMVQNTLLTLCREFQLEYRRLLHQLIFSVQVLDPNQHRFALLRIFKELQQTEEKQHPEPVWKLAGTEGHDINCSEFSEENLPPAGQLVLAIKRISMLEQGLELLQTNSTSAEQADWHTPGKIERQQQRRLIQEWRTWLIDRLQRQRHASLPERLTAMRYLGHRPDASASEISHYLVRHFSQFELQRMIGWIEPQAACFITGVLHSFIAWRRAGYLSSLKRGNFSVSMHRLILQSLPKLRELTLSDDPDAGIFQVDRFWNNFISALCEEFSVSRTDLLSDMSECLINSRFSGRFDDVRGQTIDYLADAGLSSSAAAAAVGHAESGQCETLQSAGEQWSALYENLMAALQTRYFTIYHRSDLDQLLRQRAQFLLAMQTSDEQALGFLLDQLHQLQIKLALSEPDSATGLAGPPVASGTARTRRQFELEQQTEACAGESERGGKLPLQRWLNLYASLKEELLDQLMRTTELTTGPDLVPGSLAAYRLLRNFASDRFSREQLKKLDWLVNSGLKSASAGSREVFTPEPAPDETEIQNWLADTQTWCERILAATSIQLSHGRLLRVLRHEFWQVVMDTNEHSLNYADIWGRVMVRCSSRIPFTLSGLVSYLDSMDVSRANLRLQAVLRYLHSDRFTASMLASDKSLRHPKHSETGQRHKKLTQKLTLEMSVELRLPNSGADSGTAFVQDAFARYLWHPEIEDLLSHLAQHDTAPRWANQSGPLNLLDFYRDLCFDRPQLLQRHIADFSERPRVIENMAVNLDFHCLLQAMSTTIKRGDLNLHIFSAWQRSLVHMRGLRISGHTMAIRLQMLMMCAWAKKDWKALSPDSLFKQLIWQLQRDEDLDLNLIQQMFSAHLYRFPDEVRRVIRGFFTATARENGDDSQKSALHDRKPGAGELRTSNRKSLEARMSALKKQPMQKIPIRINNAGMVVLHAYVVRLLNLLGLVEENQFISSKAQHDAVHVLQYLVTGQCFTDEQYLVLNKLLCGLPLQESTTPGWQMDEKSKSLCDGLLHSILQHWSGSGTNSLDGLRGNWLVRAGSISEEEDHWSLIVDRRSYDVLMASIPFSYSVINFPWMKKPIYVTWLN